MSRLYFRQTRLLNTEAAFSSTSPCDIWIENGTLVRIAPDLSGESWDDAELLEGGYLSPGWVDLRVHLTDPGEEYKESLQSLAAAAAHGGFTSVVTQPNTQPAIDNSGSIHSLLSRSAHLPVRILPMGALSPGAQGHNMAELYDMHQAGAIAFGDGMHPTANTGLLLRALQYLKPFGGLLMDFPLDKSLVRNAEVAEGTVATRMGLHGVPALAETLATARALQVLDHFLGRLHLGPLTTAGAVERYREALEKHPTDLSADISALYLLLCDEDMQGFDPNTKLWPPLRSAHDRSVLVKAVLEGAVAAISSGHHPQSIEEKKHDFVAAKFGASTIEVAFSVAWTALEAAGMPLEAVVDLFSQGPRQILGLPEAQIGEGKALDLTWFDPTDNWTPGIADFKSKSKYSPVIGRALKGRVKGTLCKGIWTSQIS